ncbi:GntR family transcriptional regulator [Paracoccaceae bacterium GXU_MW_L88]
MSSQKPLEEELAELAPIEGRRTLCDEVADRLRELILLEKLAPGAPVRERELAEALKISRTPLREALRILEMEELIIYSPTRRPFVADPDLETLEQNLSVLGALEALAGEQACEHATDDEIAEIESICQAMIDGSDVEDPMTFFRRDMEFHKAIVAASRNRPLLQTQQQFNARLWRARFISSRRQPDRPRTLRQHEDVVRALVARNGPACAAALRRHLETAVENITKTRTEEIEETKT